MVGRIFTPFLFLDVETENVFWDHKDKLRRRLLRHKFVIKSSMCRML